MGKVPFSFKYVGSTIANKMIENCPRIKVNKMHAMNIKMAATNRAGTLSVINYTFSS